MPVPKDHPRKASLDERHRLVEAMHSKVLTPHGLIAAGRGEAFDYLFGEKDWQFMLTAEKAAVAALMIADNPVISVNGNVAALAAREIVELAKLTGSKIEVNLFYREPGRMTAVCQSMREAGADPILGCEDEYQVELTGISHLRRVVDKRGISIADVVLVPLEDGDRTMALREQGKFAICIDLNPLSRTAQCSNISLVNHLNRAVANMIRFAKELSLRSKEHLEEIVAVFDNQANLRSALEAISTRVQDLARGTGKA